MVESVLEQLAGSGLHALQALDPVAGVNIGRAKEAVAGRLCLCGNIDYGLLFKGPARRVHEETRDLLQEVKPGGGFVLGTSNAVLREAPAEHCRALVDAWRDHGAY
jgi:uroporphyrinogen-III decarboxylase